MDVYIDTNVVEHELNNLSNTIVNINEHIVQLSINVRRANEDFTSVNFDRIEKETKTIAASLFDMNQKLEVAQSFLSKLMDIIEKYDSIRY